MRSFAQIWQSTIVQKWVMAITGIMMIGFLVGHLSGNLLIFLGPEAMNQYAVDLREILHGAAVWGLRIAMLVALVLHVRAGIILSMRNKASKGQKNSKFVATKSTVASRTMAYTGILILVYVIYHLAHFTWGGVHSEYYSFTDAAGRHDVYRMVIESFQQPVISVTYIIAMIVSGLHLNHAIKSAFQTLGVNHPRYTPLINSIGPALGLLLVLGFISIPVAILTGVVQ